MQSPTEIVMGTPTARSSTVLDTVSAIEQHPNVVADVTLVSGDKVHVSAGKRPVQEPEISEPKRSRGTTEVPKLQGSSRKEIQFAAAMGQMLHECGLVSTPLSVETLSAYLVDGKAALNTDMKFRLDVIGKDLLLEYDHDCTHKAGDVDRDVTKTNRLVEAFPSAIVMRVRIRSAPPLPSFASPNVSIVHVNSDVASLAMSEVANALKKYTETPSLVAVLGSYKQKHSPVVDRVVHDLMMKIEPKYHDTVLQLRALLGDENETRIVSVMSTHGLTERYESLLIFVRRIIAPPYNITNVETFLTGGLAAKLDDLQELFGTFDRLMQPPYSVKSLQTICNNGFCAKLDKPDELFTILDRLIQPPYSVKSLQTICNDGFCAKFDKPNEFFAILDRLMQPPYLVKSLQTICNNGFCAKFTKPDELFAILDRLMQAPYNVKSLQTICNSGFCAKFDKPDELFAILDRLLRPPYSVKSLQTICSSGFCAKFDKPDELYAILDRLIQPPYSVKSLQTICNDGFCAKFDKSDELFAILDRLIQPPYSVKSLQTICNNGFCAKFTKPDELFAILDRLIQPPYSVRSLQTICNDGFCAKFTKPDELFAILDRLMQPPFSIKNLASFICNSVAAKFDDPERFFATLCLIYTTIGASLATSITCSGAFASRMYKDGFLDNAFSIYNNLKRLCVGADAAMRLIFELHNAKLMDALDALAEKVATIKSEYELRTFLEPFKYVPGDKGRPVYAAAIADLRTHSGLKQAGDCDSGEEECDSDDE